MIPKNNPGRKYVYRGPRLPKDEDTYLLAMVLRAYNHIIKGVEYDYQPSALTKKNIQAIATTMYIFKKKTVEAFGRDLTIHDMDHLGISLKGMTDEKIKTIKVANRKEIAKIESDLRKLICSKSKRGFICYGG